jgi:hypothetical protein
MKKHFIRLCLLATVLALAVGNAEAQTTPRKPKKRTVSAATSKKKNVTKSKAGADAAVAPAKDTTAKPPVVALEADIKLDTPRKSLRNDAII